MTPSSGPRLRSELAPLPPRRVRNIAPLVSWRGVGMGVRWTGAVPVASARGSGVFHEGLDLGRELRCEDEVGVSLGRMELYMLHEFLFGLGGDRASTENEGVRAG